MSVPRTAPLDWSEVIPEAQWTLFRPVLEAANGGGPAFALGGGLAFSAYAGRKRNTKDMDLFVRPAERQHMIGMLTYLGFEDYYELMPYDRKWIYRGTKEGHIVDIIWQMANYRTAVDDDWLTRGPTIMLYDQIVRLLAPEELMWSKLYVMQRERCDWPDLLNILHAVGPEMDWNHMLKCVGDDAPLLGGLLHVFGWLCPARACELPAWLWERLGLHGPDESLSCDKNPRRVRLLDSRDWFGSQVEDNHADWRHEPSAT